MYTKNVKGRLGPRPFAAYALIFLWSAVPVKQPITKHRFENNYYNFSLRLLRSGTT